MRVERFDPSEDVGAGRTIIEASAGTGKTFTIAATVARLVAQGVGLDRILVVTFTRAATAELKGRVRSRLGLTRRALQGDEVEEEDAHLEVLTAFPAPVRAEGAARLRDALTDFDRAQIFTIHGFAQRLLGELGFRVRLPDTVQPGEVDDLLLSQVASDLVVARFTHDPEGMNELQPETVARLARQMIAHPDALVVPAPGEVEGATRLRVEMALAVATEVGRRMRAAGEMTFDDGLVEVRDALTDPLIGAAAVELLERRYDVGLVDESQDTDPIQWQIIRRIFDGSRLVVIGDPKQSIYSFRGADIESYLAAVRGAATHRTLATNWRSDGPLVEALDTLFSGATFGHQDIQYRNVEAAAPRARIHGVGAPLRLRLLDPDLPIDRRKDGYFRVGPCREMVAADTAAEVVRLLNGDVTVEDDGVERRLGPADIAVLCRTRRQVDTVRAELEARKVPSVAARTGAVLVTRAAEEWRRFLLAVERPDRLDLVRLAATTCLVGHTLPAVAALDDEGALELQRRMREWHDTLQEGGVPALLAALDRHTGLAARILAVPDGERLMTDLTHLAEELHAVFRRGRHGSLAIWLETAMQEAEERQRRQMEEPESRQRRLETDAEAVTVQTIHGAKGLQYPVVLVPYAWDVWIGDPEFPVFHDPSAQAGDEPRPRLVDLGGEDWERFAEHRRLAKQEEEAEESRLLYVALTRAQHHLVVWWVENHAAVDQAKLTQLLTGGDRTPSGLAAAGGGTIEVATMAEPAPPDHYRPLRREAARLEVARFDRETDHTWRRVSFSSLSADQPLTAVEEHTEHALKADEAEITEEPLPAAVADAALPLADLPAGARFGTLVHDLLEHLRFDSPDVGVETLALLDEQMRTGGWDFDPTVLAEGVRNALETPLGPAGDAPTLAGLEGRGLMRELAFELPVRTDGRAISLTDIGRVMDRHLLADDPYRRFVDEIMTRENLPFRGYMTGSIDLVGVLPGERYVVMDYKSNSLPTRGEAPGPVDYGPDPLAEEMVGHRYVLQATLYQVALHRYLQWRLPGYDPFANLGGSMYLFIRGMIGPQTPVIDGSRCGVARWEPPPTLVMALSRLFSGGDDG